MFAYTAPSTPSPPRSRSAPRSCVALLLALAFGAGPRDAAAQPSIPRGQRWEQTINATATHNWISTKLCVQYTSPTGKIYTGAGFWDSRNFAANPDVDVFKIRAAFNEVGNWSWQLINNAAAGCVAIAGFSPQSGGPIDVDPDTTGGIPLFAIGPVRLGQNNRFLTLSAAAVLSPFHWIGDTTWGGAHRSFLNPGWHNYLTDRKGKKYTVIQVSVPLSGSGQPADVLNRQPFVLYDAAGNLLPCPAGTVLPSSACLPYKAFWDYWDAHIHAINASAVAGAGPTTYNGMLAAVIGLFKRTVESTAWPAVADSRGYARWIAARLAGNHTALAPGFDELPPRTKTFAEVNCGGTSGSAVNQGCRARQVGAAIREAILLEGPITVPALPATRQGAPLTALVTHHIGGGCTDLLDAAPPNNLCPVDGAPPDNRCLADFWLAKFQCETWLDFQLFQSGQGGNCVSPKTQVQCLTERASRRPRTLYDKSPIKPVINGEAVYDQFGFAGGANCGLPAPQKYGPPSAIYSELRARQAAFSSLLSGSVGFTHGIGGTWDWNGSYSCRTVGEGLAAESSLQIGRLKELFQPFRWNRLLPDCQNWGAACTDITNANQATVSQELKRMFARDSNGVFAFGYLPANLPADATLRLDLSDLSAFTVGGNWATDWYNPRRLTAAGGPCYCTATPTGTGPHTFTPPASGDWGLVIRHRPTHPTLAVPACNPPDPITGNVPC